MNNVIISQPRTIDTILLEDQHKFNAYITIGLEEKNDFYVLIEFANLDSDSFKTVAELSKMTKALKINSEVIRKGEYNISHIVVTKFTSNSQYSIIWECLSDDLNFSLEL